MAGADRSDGDEAAAAEERIAELRFWLDHVGVPVTATLLDGTVVSAIYEAASADGSQIAVKQLASPIGVYPRAVLRASDLRELVFRVADGEPIVKSFAGRKAQ